MKRCAQCSFIYLDSDERCDLDGTLLQDVDESEIDQSQVRREQSSQTTGFELRRLLAVTVITILVFVGIGSLLFYISSRLGSRSAAVEHTPYIAPLAIVPMALPIPVATPYTVPSASPTRSPSAVPADPAAKSNRAPISQKAVSTSGSDGSRTSQSLIRLTNGVTILADEVWRTREGIWYRKSGMVTLIRSSEVKAIEKLRL